MDKYFPSWVRPRAFLLGALLTAIGVFSQLSFALEPIVGFFASIIGGGLFLGWVLTKCFPRWFE